MCDWKAFKTAIEAALIRDRDNKDTINHADAANVELLWASIAAFRKETYKTWFLHPGYWTCDECDRQLETEREDLLQEFRRGTPAENHFLNMQIAGDYRYGTGEFAEQRRRPENIYFAEQAGPEND